MYREKHQFKILAVFLSIFVVDTIIFIYNFVVLLI